MNSHKRHRGFIIIWGTKSRVRRDPAVLPINCPRCGGEGSVKGVVREITPTVYLVPIGPFTKRNAYLQCVKCGSQSALAANGLASGSWTSLGPIPSSIAAATPPPLPRTCPVCEEMLRPGSSFCSRCGKDCKTPTDWQQITGRIAIAMSVALVLFAFAMRLRRVDTPEVAEHPAAIAATQPAVPMQRPFAISNANSVPSVAADAQSDPPQVAEPQPIPATPQPPDPEPVTLARTFQLGSSTGGRVFEKWSPITEPIIGFRIGMIRWGNRSILHTFEPIYESDHLLATADMAMAKPGYAVSGVIANGEDQVTAIRIVFMRVADHGLDKRDSYQTNWYGSPTDPDSYLLGGTGDAVTGIYGRKGMNFDALGLIMLQEPHPKPPAHVAPTDPQAGIK